MNVKELIAELQKFVDSGDGDMLVVFSNDGEYVTFTGVEANDTILVEGHKSKSGSCVELY